MYYCTDCKIFIEEPRKKRFKTGEGIKTKLLCPICLGEVLPAVPEYCRYCGCRLPENSKSAYCDETCRRRGRKLWTRELYLRKKLRDDPIARVLRMLTSYNREHNTKYSYGQFVSLIMPGLEKRERFAYGR